MSVRVYLDERAERLVLTLPSRDRAQGVPLKERLEQLAALRVRLLHYFAEEVVPAKQQQDPDPKG